MNPTQNLLVIHLKEEIENINQKINLNINRINDQLEEAPDMEVVKELGNFDSLEGYNRMNRDLVAKIFSYIDTLNVLIGELNSLSGEVGKEFKLLFSKDDNGEVESCALEEIENFYLDKEFLSQLKIHFEETENYELCAMLRDRITLTTEIELRGIEQVA